MHPVAASTSDMGHMDMKDMQMNGGNMSGGDMKGMNHADMKTTGHTGTTTTTKMPM